MKTWKVLLASICLLFATQQARAIELTFEFGVLSSGADIYACNAGIMHPTDRDQVCFIRGTGETCDPRGLSGEHNCVCTGRNGGAYLMDYVRAEYAEYRGGVREDRGRNSVITQPAVRGNQFSELFSSKESWQKDLRKLDFKLGSEKYGAKYFVDICYRAPVIPYHEDKISALWSAEAQIRITDQNRDEGSRNYQQRALPKVSAKLLCDLQGKGEVREAGEAMDLDYPFAVHNDWDVMPPNKGDKKLRGGPTFISGTDATLINGTIEHGIRAPRLCKVRYIVEETSDGQRFWDPLEATFRTFTRIEEDDTN